MEEQNNIEKQIEGQVELEELVKGFEGFPLGKAIKDIMPLVPESERSPEYNAKRDSTITRVELAMLLMDIALQNMRKEITEGVELPAHSGFLYNFKDMPIGAITAPIDFYIQQKGIQSATQEVIEQQKADFLIFFNAFWSEWPLAADRLEKEQETTSFEQVIEETLRTILPNLKDFSSEDLLLQQNIIRTIYPLTFILPIDKVTKLAFAGELTEQLQPLAMESRKSKRPVTTFASINFSAPQLQGLKGLTYYDRSVYNAICTLYARGGNEYITRQMIYQVMAGNEDAYLNPKQAADIGNSITKFMYGGVHIDATEEVKRHNIGGSFIYDTNLLHAERGRFNLNGTITECIHILRPPVLLEYSSSKNQIANIPIMALATPINNNSDVLALKAYLLDRVSGMRGADPQRDISYNSI